VLRIEYKESAVYSNGGFLCWKILQWRVIEQMRNRTNTQTIAVRKVIGIVRILKWVVWGEGQLAIIIQKRSQCSTVTALFINYCFV